MTLIEKIAMFIGWYGTFTVTGTLMIYGLACLLTISIWFFPFFLPICAWILFGALYPLRWIE